MKRAGTTPAGHGKKRCVLFVLTGLCLAALVIMLLRSNFGLKTTAYTVQLDALQGEVKLVYLSDLHGRSFGKDNERLLRRIEAAQPDLIAVVGDMLPDKPDDAALRRFAALLERLCALAPVYVSYGNGELTVAEFAQTVEASGATLLDETFVQVQVRGSTLRLGGLYNYAFAGAKTQQEWEQSATFRFLCDFEDTQLPTVLLCHRPDSFIFFRAYETWDIDLVLCGHTHGGVIRLPFVGGLTATDQDLFPPYDYGSYTLGSMKLLITSGFAGHDWIPRVCNEPELVCVALQP